MGGVDPTDKLANGKATMILLKLFIGPGMLSLPFALSHAGYVVGTTCLMGFALCSIFGVMYILASLIYHFTRIVPLNAIPFSASSLQYMGEVCQLVRRTQGVVVTTYPDLARAVGGPKIGDLVAMVACFTQLSVCCVTVNFVAANVLAILPCETVSRAIEKHGKSDGWHDHGVARLHRTSALEYITEPHCFGLDPLPAKRVLIAAVLPVFMILSWIQNMKTLAPMAKYANLAMVIVLISVYGLAFRALKEVGKATSFVATPHTPQAFFLFCGNCFYSFEGVATIVPLIAAMEDQTAVPRVLGTALAVILALQVSLAFICYAAFQDIDSGSLTAVLATNRRLNVPPAAVLALNLLVVFAVLITFPIHLYPALQLLEKRFGFVPSSQLPPATTKAQQHEDHPNGSASSKSLNERTAVDRDKDNPARHHPFSSTSHHSRHAYASVDALDREEQHISEESSGHRGRATGAGVPRTGARETAPAANENRSRSSSEASDATQNMDDEGEILHSSDDGGRSSDHSCSSSSSSEEHSDDGGGDSAMEVFSWRKFNTFDYRELMADDDFSYDWYNENDGSAGGATSTKGCLPFNRLVFRASVVLCLGLVAEAIPDLALLMDIFGSVFGTFLAIILPRYLSICSTPLFKTAKDKAKHIQNHWHKRMVIGVIVLFAFGALGASIQEMFEPH